MKFNKLNYKRIVISIIVWFFAGCLVVLGKRTIKYGISINIFRNDFRNDFFIGVVVAIIFGIIYEIRYQKTSLNTNKKVSNE